MINKKRSIGKVATSKEILTSLITVSLLLYIERTRILYCGSIPDKTTVTQLQDFIQTLPDEEAEEFARRIEFVRDVQYAEEVVSVNPSRWESVAIFVIATTALFIAARYEEIIIRDAFVNLPNHVSLPSEQDIYAGMT